MKFISHPITHTRIYFQIIYSSGLPRLTQMNNNYSHLILYITRIFTGNRGLCIDLVEYTYNRSYSSQILSLYFFIISFTLNNILFLCWRLCGKYMSPFDDGEIFCCQATQSDQIPLVPRLLSIVKLGYSSNVSSYKQRSSIDVQYHGLLKAKREDHVPRRGRPCSLIAIVVRGGLCFQERAGSRIGGSPEEALHDRGVFSGHHDECRGSGARQGTLNPRTTNTRKPSPTNQPTLHQCPPRGRSRFLFPCSSLGYYTVIRLGITRRDGRSIYILMYLSLSFSICIYILSILIHIFMSHVMQSHVDNCHHYFL